MWWLIPVAVVAALVAAVADGSGSPSTDSARAPSTQGRSSPPSSDSSAQEQRDLAARKFCQWRLDQTRSFFKRRGLPDFEVKVQHWQPSWAGYKDWVRGVIYRRYEEESQPPPEMKAVQAALADIEDYLRDLEPER